MRILSTTLLTLALTLPGFALAADLDGDGVDAAWDCDDQDASVSPLATENPITADDEDCDGTPGAAADSDGDGLNDVLEGLLGTDPDAWDSDGDELSDADEVDLSQDALPNFDGDALIDPLDPDDDGDGIGTVYEASFAQDLDGDGFPNWLDLDDDGDGFASGTAGPGWDNLADDDFDGLPNFADSDDDGDGVPTALEGGYDSNGDLIPDALTYDDDGDGIPTPLEDTNGNGDWFDDDADGDGIPDFRDPELSPGQDGDGDGYGAPGDCDDTDASVHPFADEICDGIDNDCDGFVDNPFGADELEYFPDLDGDGYGDGLVGTVVTLCPPAGFVTEGGDCDDSDPTVHPGADDVCDGVDNDCDGVVDDVMGGSATVFFTDLDQDGFGDPATQDTGLCVPEGAVLNGDDCDDSDPETHPAAEDLCDDGIDQDCDGADATCVGTSGGCVTSGVGGSYALLLLPPLWIGGRRRRSA